MIAALMTNKNNPNVSMVSGMVNKMSKGFTKVFKNPNTMATKMATK